MTILQVLMTFDNMDKMFDIRPVHADQYWLLYINSLLITATSTSTNIQVRSNEHKKNVVVSWVFNWTGQCSDLSWRLKLRKSQIFVHLCLDPIIVSPSFACGCQWYHIIKHGLSTSRDLIVCFQLFNGRKWACPSFLDPDLCISNIYYIYISYIYISYIHKFAHISHSCWLYNHHIISYKGWPDGNQKWPMWSPIDTNIWGFPEMGIAGYPNSWLVYNGTSENKLDDLGAPPWHRKHPYCGWKKSCTSWKRLFIPLFIGFQPSKVVQDFFHPQYDTNAIDISLNHQPIPASKTLQPFGTSEGMLYL